MENILSDCCHPGTEKPSNNSCSRQLTIVNAEVTLVASGVRSAGTKRRSQVPGHRSQVAGPRSQVAGRRSQVAGPRSQVASRRSQVTGHRKFNKKVRYLIRLFMFICFFHFRLRHDQAYVCHRPCLILGENGVALYIITRSKSAAIVIKKDTPDETAQKCNVESAKISAIPAGTKRRSQVPGRVH